MIADSLIESIRTIVRRVLDDRDYIDFTARYVGRVASQSGNEVDVFFDDARLGTKRNVPLAVMPGLVLTLSAGTRISVGWIGGDERLPRAYPEWDTGGALTGYVLTVPTAEIDGKLQVDSDALVEGNQHVKGNSQVDGNEQVNGDLTVLGDEACRHTVAGGTLPMASPTNGLVTSVTLLAGGDRMSTWTMVTSDNIGPGLALFDVTLGTGYPTAAFCTLAQISGPVAAGGVALYSAPDPAPSPTLFPLVHLGTGALGNGNLPSGTYQVTLITGG